MPKALEKIPKTPLVEYITREALGEDDDGNYAFPTLEVFTQAARNLQPEQMRTLVAMLTAETFAEYFSKLCAVKPETVTSAQEMMDPQVMRAYYYGLVAKLPTLAAKEKFIQSLVAKNSKAITVQQTELLVMTSKDHLAELAEQILVSGDGKREVLKNIIAYAMQAKQVEAPVLDDDKNLISPAVYGLADPKIAHSCIQELNRMDHEYGEDDKATSSIESQHKRLMRIKKNMEKASKAQAKALGGVAKQISKDNLVSK